VGRDEDQRAEQQAEQAHGNPQSITLRSTRHPATLMIRDGSRASDADT
jgi:hypothetical protein